MITTKQRLLFLAVFAAMTTACSSGGSSLNTGGGSTIPTNGDNDPTTPETPKTQYEKVEDSSITKLNQADNSEPVEYGYSIASPFTGGGSYGVLTDEQKIANASIDTTKSHTEENADNYDTLTFINSPESTGTKPVTITKNEFTNTLYADTNEYYPLSGDINDDIKDNAVLVIDGNTYEALRMIEFDYTKAGAVIEAGGDKYANIFYRGKNASKLLPSSGKAQYHGAWEVVRKVEMNPGEAIPGYGVGDELNKRAAAKFTVDFSDKSITGDLNRNEAKGQAFAYKLDGTINGNTFTAEATSTTEATNEDKAKVTGGFFGEQAAELAGKLISENAAGVFAAKQEKDADITKGEKVVYNQAKAINFDEKSTPVFTTSFENIMENTEKLSNLDEITLNGVKINLIKAAENSDIFTNTEELPLQFTRIGAVQADAKEPTYTYFYQGQLTQAMPETGTASYEGNWIGYGQAQDGPAFSMSKESNGLIKFKADFVSNALSGEFLTASGKNAMTLHEVGIKGNTFKGTAKITDDGLVNDNHTNKGAIKGEVMLSGGFFGDNANELGGQFNKEDLSFAGVFAGKQTAKK